MTWYYLRLRSKQFWRFFTFNQFNPVLGILLLAAVFMMATGVIFVKAPHAEWVYALLGLGVVVQLQSAGSNNFLKGLLDQTTLFKVKLAENTLLILPFVAGLLWHKAFLPAACLYALILPYPWLNFTIAKPRARTMFSPFLKYSFEFNAGFRIYPLVFVLYVFLMVAGIVSRNFYVFLLPFFIVLFFESSFYGYVEAPFNIWIYRKSPVAFLLSKMKSLAVNYAISNTLFVLLGLVFYTSHWPLILFAAFIGLLSLTGGMLIKYHFYPSELFIQISQMVFFGVAVAGMLNPVFLLPALLFLPFSFIKARQKLKPLLC